MPRDLKFYHQFSSDDQIIKYTKCKLYYELGSNYEAPTRYTIKTNTFQYPISTIAAVKPTRDFAWLEGKLQSGLEGFSLSVRPAKKLNAAASADDIVSTVLNLDATKSSELHFQLSQGRGGITASPEAKKLIKLAVFDLKEWESFFQDTIKRPQENDALFNALVPVFAKMSMNLRNQISDWIQAAYPDISSQAWLRKGIFLKKVYGLISPQDALDVITNQVFPAKNYFEDRLKKGVTTQAAYGSFLADQHIKFYSKSARIKKYSADVIKTISEKIQLAIKKNPDLFGKEGVQIVGRFPNGRADMDDLNIEFIVADPLNKKIAHELSYALNGKTKRRAKEFIEVDIKTIETTTTKEAIVNPIQIKITKDTIELHVHSPIQNMDRDRYQLPHNYPAPAVYEIPTLNTVAEVKEAS